MAKHEDLNRLKSSVNELHQILNAVVSLSKGDKEKYREQLNHINRTIQHEEEWSEKNPGYESNCQSIAKCITDFIVLNIRLLTKKDYGQQAKIIAKMEEGGLEQLFQPVFEKLKPFIKLERLLSDLEFLQAGHGISEFSFSLNEMFHHLQTIENKSIKMIVGDTGSGKTAFMLYMLRQKLFQVDEIAIASNYLEVEDNEYPEAVIGNGVFESVTLYPRCFGEENYCDMPAFNTELLLASKINNTMQHNFSLALTKSLLKENKAIITVIEASAFYSSYGEPFKKLLQGLGASINIQELTLTERKNFLFVINLKGIYHFDKHFLIQTIKQQKTSLEKRIAATPDIKEYKERIYHDQQALAAIDLISEENLIVWTRFDDPSCRMRVEDYLSQLKANIPKTAINFEDKSKWSVQRYLRAVESYCAKNYFLDLKEHYNTKQKCSAELRDWERLVNSEENKEQEQQIPTVEAKENQLRAALVTCNQAIEKEKAGHLAVYERLQFISKISIEPTKQTVISNVLAYLDLCQKLYGIDQLLSEKEKDAPIELSPHLLPGLFSRSIPPSETKDNPSSSSSSLHGIQGTHLAGKVTFFTPKSNPSIEIDKQGFAEEILQAPDAVIYIAAPPFFGKSNQLKKLKEFIEMGQIPGKEGETFPVIYLQGSNWAAPSLSVLKEKLYASLREIYLQYAIIEESLSRFEKKDYELIKVSLSLGEHNKQGAIESVT